MIEVSLPPFDNPPPELRVRGLMCGDDQGQVQVVAPERALVEPASITAATARQLDAMSGNAGATICAIPGFYDVPTVVHTALMERPDLALATEQPGAYVRASGRQLADLCHGTTTHEAMFCEHMVPVPATTFNDEADIFAALDEFTARRIEKRLDETLHIPPLPDAAQRIIALQRDPDFDLSDLVRIIETDPSIAARIMGWANSAFYGAPTPAKSIHDAIMRVLGVDLVFNMAIGLSIGATLRLPASQVNGANPYWLDAVFGAATMEALALQIPGEAQPNPGLAYLCGLLHNFGTLVVGHVFPQQYESICRLQEINPHLSSAPIDQHVLRLNREVIAATLLEQWELPEELTTALRFQNVTGAYDGHHGTFVALLKLTKRLLHDPAMVHDPDTVQSAAELGISAENMSKVVELLTESHDELELLADALVS